MQLPGALQLQACRRDRRHGRRSHHQAGVAFASSAALAAVAGCVASVGPGERSHRDTAGDRAQLVGERAVAGPGRTAGAAGKRGGWVAGDLRWDRLHMLRYSDYPAAQVRLLQELYATYRTSRSNSTVYYGYSYGDEKTMALLRFDSPQLWPLLDEARRVGVRLLQPRPGRTFRRTPPRGCAWM
ncbi:SNF2-like domain protein [Mycobacterium xenopi 3993]|nr:SNF2-like domain protein [Mycobacterium xenopi 3993]